MEFTLTAHRVTRPEAVTRSAVADQAPENAQETYDQTCGVPSTASTQVKVTRLISVITIVIHAIALFFDRVFWGQRLASLIAIATGCVVLCHFNRCDYTSAAVLYTIGMIFDILTVLFWSMFTETLDKVTTDDDTDDNEDERAVRIFAITPALGALFQFLGAIFASLAACCWQNSGAPDAVEIIESSSPVRFPNKLPLQSNQR